MATGNFFDLSNCTYDVDLSSGKPALKNLKIGGKSVNPAKEYKIAVTEGIGLGAKEIADGVLSPLVWPADTGVPVWDAVEEKLSAAEALLRCHRPALRREVETGADEHSFQAPPR